MNIKITIFFILALILFTGLFFFLKPKSSTPITLTTPAIQEKIFEFIVKGEEVVSGPDTIKVTEGDMVTIKATVDKDEELHLHGYNLKIELKKDTSSEINFMATLTGRFDLEFHESGMELGAIEVSPK